MTVDGEVAVLRAIPSPARIGSAEIRCPGAANHGSCGRLVAVVSDDFDGTLAFRCPRCKTDFGYPADASVPTARLTCDCGKLLCLGVVRAGWLQIGCRRDLAIVRVSAADGRSSVPRPRLAAPANDDLFVRAIEARRREFRTAQVRQRVGLAVGVRFDVFNRDGFRCRYCGRGPDQGVLLGIDHVIPRARGGTDASDNLVTACEDCNTGKSSKPLAGLQGVVQSATLATD